MNGIDRSAARETSRLSGRCYHAIRSNIARKCCNQGWYAHGEDKALYDQQPIEAATTAEAAVAAHDLLGDEQFLATFRRALDARQCWGAPDRPQLTATGTYDMPHAYRAPQLFPELFHRHEDNPIFPVAGY